MMATGLGRIRSDFLGPNVTLPGIGTPGGAEECGSGETCPGFPSGLAASMI